MTAADSVLLQGQAFECQELLPSRTPDRIKWVLSCGGYLYPWWNVESLGLWRTEFPWYNFCLECPLGWGLDLMLTPATSVLRSSPRTNPLSHLPYASPESLTSVNHLYKVSSFGFCFQPTPAMNVNSIWTFLVQPRKKTTNLEPEIISTVINLCIEEIRTQVSQRAHAFTDT